MTLQEAKELLGDAIQPNGHLHRLGQYLSYQPGENTACLDADFTADELEAVAVYMRANT